MTATATRERGVLESALWAVAIAAAPLAVLAYFLFGARGLGASLVGSVLAVANLWSVALIVRGLLGDSRHKSRYALFAVIKITLLLGAVFALITSGLTPILPMALGYAALPIGIVIGQLWAGTPAEDDPAPDKG